MELTYTNRMTLCLEGKPQRIPKGISEFGVKAPRFNGYRVAVNSKSKGVWIGQVYFSASKHGSYDKAFEAAVEFLRTLPQ